MPTAAAPQVARRRSGSAGHPESAPRLLDSSGRCSGLDSTGRRWKHAGTPQSLATVGPGATLPSGAARSRQSWREPQCPRTCQGDRPLPASWARQCAPAPHTGDPIIEHHATHEPRRVRILAGAAATAQWPMATDTVVVAVAKGAGVPEGAEWSRVPPRIYLQRASSSDKAAASARSEARSGMNSNVQLRFKSCRLESKADWTSST